MAFDLQALLQGIGGGMVDPNSITVDAATPKPTLQNIAAVPASLDPSKAAELSPMEGIPERKGMFGLKGTLRDVLGLIGDSLVGGAGGNLIYTPQRRKEEIADAAIGFSGTPKEQLAAIQRVGLLDPTMAQQMFNQYNQNQLGIDKLEVQRDANTASQQRMANSQKISKAKLMPGLLSAAKGNPDQQAALKAWYEDPSSSIEDLDPDIIAASAVTPYQQAMLGQGEQRLKQGQQNADANTLRASRPPQGRAPRAETADERYIRIADKPNPTKGEQAWLANQQRQRGSTRRSAPSSAAPSGAPQKGFKKGGYTFQGGNPSDPKNWKKD